MRINGHTSWVATEELHVTEVRPVRLGDGCDGGRLFESAGLSLREERMPPGTAERLHLHERARQLFHALEGTCVIITQDGHHVIEPFTGVVVDPANRISSRAREQDRRGSCQSAGRAP